MVVNVLIVKSVSQGQTFKYSIDNVKVDGASNIINRN
jgi:hypothetical protein